MSQIFGVVPLLDTADQNKNFLVFTQRAPHTELTSLFVKFYVSNKIYVFK